MTKVPNLLTDRLILEKIEIRYASDEYVFWMNDEEVYKYLETGGSYSKSDLETYPKAAEENDQLHFWAIRIKANQKHIGNIKIDPINFRHGYGEYGILMGDRDEWGKGYAQEASEVVIEYCFNSLKIRKVTLGVVADNIGAVKLYHKLGFVQEGLYKYQGLYNN